MMDTDAARHAMSEWDVHDWWMALFVESGFEPWQAEILIENGVDWHDADDLKKRGCPSATAVMILT